LTREHAGSCTQAKPLTLLPLLLPLLLALVLLLLLQLLLLLLQQQLQKLLLPGRLLPWLLLPELLLPAKVRFVQLRQLFLLSHVCVRPLPLRLLLLLLLFEPVLLQLLHVVPEPQWLSWQLQCS
jgi:hypothetical protein